LDLSTLLILKEYCVSETGSTSVFSDWQ